ncbi:STAS domain-containing protein [Pseudoalteromonas sp. SSDWG2]|uniref:STAS domain-containing protein n=1 Tax=Pseudoalteromonas sp. SSDWG2 TaxID=3139391 RepID=UPI003BABBEF0
MAKNPSTTSLNQTQNKTIKEQNDTIGEQSEQLERQQEQLVDLQEQIKSAKFDLPLLKIAEDILMVPLVGSMDSAKAQKVMEDILINIRNQETRVVIIDIAGVNIVDSSVAAHLIKIAKATKLMGCRSIISGISPIIAHNIVNLGMNVDELTTTNTLKDAMAKAYGYVGLALVEMHK